MELVYLWVKEYKNIYHQGFNFSLRFNCEYDGEKLTIKPKKHIKNFFGDNINITAIVGKNGSGKSNILGLINDKHYENPLHSPYPLSSSEWMTITIYYNEEENKFYIKDEKKLIKEKDNQSSIEIVQEEQTKEFVKKILIQPTPSHSQKEYLVLFDFLKNNNSVKFPFDIPKIIDIGIHDDDYDLLELIRSDKFDFDTNYNVFEEDEDKRLKIFHTILLLAYLKNYKINFKIEASEDYDETIIELEARIEKTFKEDINKFINEIKNNLEDFTNNTNHYIDINKIPNNFFKIYMNIIKRKEDSGLLDFKGKEVFSFDLYPKMSDGQYQFTYLFSEIYSYINGKNNILCIDEGENYLHPNWQKTYFSYLLKFIEDNFPKKKIHIILTTHSPFLLSDLPKENVIFLDTDNKGNSKIVNGLKDKKQTFGANIHTLLSDGFFMSDGLMGEFAKGKINEIINYLSKDGELITIKKNQVKNIIELIGEPFLKEKLLSMYNKKFHIKSKDEEISELKEEIQRLKNAKN